MNAIRIIPRLDVKGPNLVKGIHLEGLRVLGKPEVFARFYYESGADELYFQDAVASLYDRNSLHDIISKTAKEIFIPLTVGGGIRTLDDIKMALRAGADKVAINTGAMKRPEFIREAARKFGSSTIVVAIEAIRQPGGEYLAYTDNGREHTGLSVREWAMQVEELGAGEIVITSVDREGTGNGFDIELTRMITNNVSIPVVAHGGASGPEDVLDVVKNTDTDAVAIASILHYDCIRNLDLINADYQAEGNLTFVRSGKNFSRISPCTIADVRNRLLEENIYTRTY